MMMIVALAVVAGVCLLTMRYVSVAREHSAEEILKQRYARGEIDDAEYQRQLTVLHQSL